MNALLRIAMAGFALVMVPAAVAQSSFVHPGISHKKSDLERIKRMVEAQIDPWYSSYQQMAADSKAGYDYVVRGSPTFTELGRDSGVNYGAWNSDIRAAYYNAIRWYVTGDTRHADKAVEIFNAWSNLTSVTSGGTDSLSGGVGYIMIEAAEIIKSTYSGWAAADIQKFKDMLVYPGYSSTSVPTGTKTFYWMSYQGDPGRHGNQGLSGWRTVMAMGIFLDNRVMYERALRYIQGLPHRSDDLAYPSGPRATTTLISSTDYVDSYNTVTSSSIPDYGYNEVMTNYIWENGQCQESSRDQQHTFFGIGLLCSMAEMAWNQGADLYSHANDRLLLGLEWNMRHNVSAIRSYPDQTGWWVPTVESGEFIQRLDRTARWFSKAISPDGVGGFANTRPVFEMPLAHYLGRGIKTNTEVKWTERARDVSIEDFGYEKAGWTNDAIGWGALTFRRPAFCYGDPISGFSSGLPAYAMNVLPGIIEAENYDYFTTNGQGRTYHDLTRSNTGGVYRTSEGVDVATCPEGGHALTSLENGEWLTYTVAVPATGLYDLSIRYAASQAGAKIKFSFGGVDKTNEVSIPFGAPDSTGLSDWKTFTVASGVPLAKGVQCLKISISGSSGAFLLNHLAVIRASSALAGYWRFDESSGSIAADSSGNGYHGTNTNTTWVTGMDGGALGFNGSTSKVAIPSSAFGTIGNEITISMWAYGSAAQPMNNSAFYATAGSTRVLNIHLPWSDSNVFWDAGNSTGYDRIYKLATDTQAKGSWNHWAFTKDAVAGTMKIYHNGVLWHSGTGKTKSISGITAAAIGSQITGISYSGSIDDVRLYNSALSDAEIAGLYYQNPTFAVGGLAATPSSGSQIDLSWTAASGATAYNIKRSLTNGGPYMPLASGLTTTSYADTGLSRGTTYHYVVTAVYNGAEGRQSDQASAVPAGPIGSVPVIATASLPTGFVGSPYQQALTATGGDGALTWSLTSGTLPTGIILSATGTLSGTPTTTGTVSFTVRATDADGDEDTRTLEITISPSANAPPAKFAVGAGNVTASSFQDPNVPANTLDGSIGSRWSAQGDGQWIRYDLGAEKIVHSIKIAWFSGNSRVSRFHIEVSRDENSWTALTGTLPSSGSTTALETTPVSATLARYVRIVGHGNSTNNGWNSITEVEIWGTNPPPPSIPTNLTPTPGNGQVALNWSASEGATLHHIKRSTTSGGDFATIASTAGSSFIDTEVVNGTTYHYVVSAGNAAGESADSAPISAKPRAPISANEFAGPALISSGESIGLSVLSVPGRIYQLQRSGTLTPGSWQNVGTPIIGDGNPLIVSDPSPLRPNCFYRLEIQP